MRQGHLSLLRSQHLQPTCLVAPSSHRQRWQQQQQQQQRCCVHTQPAHAATIQPLQLQSQRASRLKAAAGSDSDKTSRQQAEPEVDPAAADEDEDEWDSDDDEGGEFEYADDDEGEWDEDEDWEDEEGEEEAAVSTARQIPQNQATVDFTQDDFVEVGLISRPHGVRGEVKVQLITDEPRKRLGTAGKRLWLQALPMRSGLVPPSVAAARQGGAAGAASDPFKTLRRVVVQSGRVARPGGKSQREEWAVKFEGFDSREKAADLAGHKLLLALCDREARPRGRDEFFIDQLVGLKAVDAGSDNARLVGIVTEVYENGASYSLLRVRLAPEEADIAESKFRSVLVPFVSEIVPTVDVAGGQLGLRLPEGLLQTASTTKLRKPYTPAQQAQLREQLKKRQQQ